MKLKVIVHDAEEGGYWAEVPSIAGCATQGDTFDELLTKTLSRYTKLGLFSLKYHIIYHLWGI